MTQPNDPRKVKVIVELIDHTIKIAEAQDRGDLAGRMAKAKERISDPQILLAGLIQGGPQLIEDACADARGRSAHAENSLQRRLEMPHQRGFRLIGVATRTGFEDLDMLAQRA